MAGKNAVTDKQERFIRNQLNGMSQRQAYREAYPNSRKWKDKNVDSRASNLLKNDKVLARYLELKEEIERKHKEKRLWGLEQATKGLLWIMQQAQADIKEKGFRQANSSAFINAMKELNDLEALGKEREVKVDLDTARIEKIKSEITSVENTENILKEYFEALGKAVKDDELA